jgi:hypothetical protein
MEKKTLKRKEANRAEVHRFVLHIPLALWARMVKVLMWGETTKFILDAITEKLDRMDQEQKDK